MRVLIDALNIRWGGGLTVMQRVASGFLSKGHDVLVLVNGDKLADTLREESGLTVKACHSAQSALGALKFRHSGLREVESEFSPDVLFSFNYYTPSATPQVTYHINTMPYLPLRERIKTVGWARAFALTHYAKQALAKSRLNLFESQYLRDIVASQCAIVEGRIAHIGADAPAAVSERRTPAKAPVYSCVTSGAPHKRNDVVFEAFRKVQSQHCEAKLNLVGEPDHIRSGMSDSDRQWANASDAVTFTGYVDRDRLYDILSQSTCLVTASELESFFMVAIEAMRVNCPVVATDISSIAESTGGNALLYPAGDSDAAAAHMLHLHAEPASVDLTSIQAWADRFDAQTCARNIVEQVRNLELGAK